MAEDVEVTLCELMESNKFPLQVDESTLPGNEALLLAYVRLFKEVKIIQYMLFARTLMADTKGEYIFNTVKDYFKEKNIPHYICCHRWSVCNGGSLSSVHCLYKEVPGIFAVHCVIYRQHLVAKNLSDRLHQSLRYVISTVNKIRSNFLNDRLFAKLCKDNNEEFNRLILHTEV